MARFGAAIVARFRAQGKPDRARKSRTFKYLGYGLAHFAAGNVDMTIK
jgi:hypothetical protein